MYLTRKEKGEESKAGRRTGGQHNTEIEWGTHQWAGKSVKTVTEISMYKQKGKTGIMEGKPKPSEKFHQILVLPF